MDKWLKKMWGNRPAWCILLFVLAFCGYYLQLIRMFENGYKVGEVTFFSMMILCMIGFFYGAVPGFISSFLFGLLLYLIDTRLHVSPTKMSEMLDYLLGYTMLGFCGVFSPVAGIKAKRREREERDKEVKKFAGSKRAEGSRADTKSVDMRLCFFIAVFLRFAESVWDWSFFRDVPVSFLSDLQYGIVNCIGYIGMELVLSLIFLSLPPVKDAISFLVTVATTKHTEKYDFF